MKVGDLVRIKYNGAIALITKVETIQVYPRKGGDGTWRSDPYWIHLLDQQVAFKAGELEVINESR
jgi:hypothetical protein